MATVHAFDTEAEIGSRPVFDKTEVEKLLIKRKINQTERVRLLTETACTPMTPLCAMSLTICV